MEIRQIPGFSLYSVSNEGDIFNNKGKKLSPRNSRGYRTISLINDNGECKQLKLGRMVALAFPEICGEYFEGAEVDHINRDKSDNRAVNLRWCTHIQNMEYYYGKPCFERKKGFRLHTPKNPVMQFKKNGKFVKWWSSISKAIKETGISRSTIYDCAGGRRLSAGKYLWIKDTSYE